MVSTFRWGRVSSRFLAHKVIFINVMYWHFQLQLMMAGDGLFLLCNDIQIKNSNIKYKYKIQNTKYKIQNTKYKYKIQIQNTNTKYKYKIQIEMMAGDGLFLLC